MLRLRQALNALKSCDPAHPQRTRSWTRDQLRWVSSWLASQQAGMDVEEGTANACVVYDSLRSRTVLGVVGIPTPDLQQVLIKMEAAILAGPAALDARNFALARACSACGASTRPVLQCGNMCGVIVGLGAAVDQRSFRINQVRACCGRSCPWPLLARFPAKRSHAPRACGR